MLIIVQLLTGKKIEIDIEPTDSVGMIKERLEQITGIPPRVQRLIYRESLYSGTQMNDSKTIGDYKIQAGSVLYFCIGLGVPFQLSKDKMSSCDMPQ